MSNIIKQNIKHIAAWKQPFTIYVSSWINKKITEIVVENLGENI